MNKRKCVVCGQEYVPRTGNQKYCSYDCKYKRDLEKIREKRTKRTVRIYPEKVCPTCGKKFTPKTSQQKYCSQHCRFENNKTKPKRKQYKKRCPVCNEIFYTNMKKQKTCSVRCGRKINKMTVLKSTRTTALDATLKKMKMEGYKPHEYGLYKKMKYRETGKYV